MKRHVLFVLGMALLVATAAFAGIHTRSGKVYNQNSQWKEAVRELLLAIEEDPKDDEAHFQLAFAYSNLDSVALAYKHFMKAKELQPKKARDVDDNIKSNYARHYKAGQAAFGRSDFRLAAVEFERATFADPMQSAAHYNLAVSFSRLASTDSTYNTKVLAEADKVLELAPPSDPNYAKSLQLAARQLVELGQVDEAVARFQTLVEKDPEQYAMVEETANEMFNMRNWKGASALLRMAADARAAAGTEDFQIYFNIGVAEFNLGKEDPAHIDEAVIYYEKALAVQPDDGSTVYNLMAAYITKADWSNAALWGEKYVSVSPADPKGWQLLARCYGELGDDEKAAEALSRYQQLKSQ